MALVRYEPLSLLNRFQQEFNRFGLLDPFLAEDTTDGNSEVTVNHWRPAVDIKEEEQSYVIYADLPGIDKKDIEITMDNGVLTLKGERNYEKEEEKEGFRRVERSRGTFYRRFSLPETVDADNIVATGKDGVLEIRIPKQEKLQSRRIEVKS